MYRDDAAALTTSQAKSVIQRLLGGIGAVNANDQSGRTVSPGATASRRAHLTSRRIRTRVRDAHDPLPKPPRIGGTANYIGSPMQFSNAVRGYAASVAQQHPRVDDGRDPAEALYLLIVTVVRRMPRDISLTQLSTLSTIAATGPRRITDLAAIQGIAQPSMTELIAALERAELVRRERDPLDGRVSLATLTAAGRDYVRDHRRAATKSLAELVAKLPDPDRAALTAAVPGLVHLRELGDQSREPRRTDQLPDPGDASSRQ